MATKQGLLIWNSDCYVLPNLRIPVWLDASSAVQCTQGAGQPVRVSYYNIKLQQTSIVPAGDEGIVSPVYVHHQARKPKGSKGALTLLTNCYLEDLFLT